MIGFARTVVALSLGVLAGCEDPASTDSTSTADRTDTCCDATCDDTYTWTVVAADGGPVGLFVVSIEDSNPFTCPADSMADQGMFACGMGTIVRTTRTPLYVDILAGANGSYTGLLDPEAGAVAPKDDCCSSCVFAEMDLQLL